MTYKNCEFIFVLSEYMFNISFGERFVKRFLLFIFILKNYGGSVAWLVICCAFSVKYDDFSPALAVYAYWQNGFSNHCAYVKMYK